MTTQVHSGPVVEAGPAESEFQAGRIITIVSGHFVHDTFQAFLAPLLPLLIERLSISLALAGTLAAFMQAPAVLNPFIGYLSDRVSLRYFVILAPAVTATLISSLGLAPSYPVVAIMLVGVGISSAAFHAPSPAMIGRISGRRVGTGMSWFMAGGELGRTVGPLLAVWAVTRWTLDGYYRVMVVGWIATLFLYWRLRDVPGSQDKPADLREGLPIFRRLFLPLLLILVFRAFMRVPLVVYLPTFLRSEGASLLVAGGALAIFEMAAVVGALTSGPLSDRIGRKSILIVSMLTSGAFIILFLQVSGWMLVPVLVAMGFVSLLTTPVIMALVQDSLPNHRAVGNGIFILIAFLSMSAATVITGLVGDRFGLRTTYYVGAVASLVAAVPVLWLPESGSEISA